jgi:hypothetical protein
VASQLREGQEVKIARLGAKEHVVQAMQRQTHQPLRVQVQLQVQLQVQQARQ